MNDVPKIRCDGWLGRARIGTELWVALIGAIVTGAIAWGALNKTVEGHTIAIEKTDARVARLEDKIESLMVSAASIQGKLDILVAAELRRQQLK